MFCLSDCLSVCSLRVSKFSHFSLFHPPLFIQYSTEECSTVQYKAAGHRTHKTSLRVKKRFQNQCRVQWLTPPGVTSERRLARSTRRYIGTALRGALYSLSPYCFIIIVRLVPIYKVYSIGRTWSWPVMSAAACYYMLFDKKIKKTLNEYN